jgi:hypothetical protein
MLLRTYTKLILLLSLNATIRNRMFIHTLYTERSNKFVRKLIPLLLNRIKNKPAKMLSEISTEQQIQSLQTEIQNLKEQNIQLLNLKCTNTTAVSFQDAKGFILHKGEPPDLHECSRCREKKDSSHFGYYSQRVDKYGYLMRSNALCKDCRIETDKERKTTLKKAGDEGKIPPQPEAGATCPNCNRPWGSIDKPRNWHRDHDAIKNEFRRWLCGDCNMAKHDHRHGIS